MDDRAFAKWMIDLGLNPLSCGIKIEDLPDLPEEQIIKYKKQIDDYNVLLKRLCASSCTEPVQDEYTGIR